jgi:signal transduction histidine kinase
MMSGTTGAESRQVDTEIRATAVRLLAVGLVAVILVTVPTVLIGVRIAREHALDTAVTNGRNLTQRVLVPHTTSSLVKGDTASLACLDEAVRQRMSDGSVMGVRVFSRDGTVVYSDAQALIGRTYPLADVVPALTAADPTHAELTEVNELGFGGPAEAMVEVYTLALAATGEHFIYETYFPAAVVKRIEQDLVLQMMPVGLAALVLLMLTQLVPAVRLARNVQRGKSSRERLLAQAVAAVDLERRRLAQGLHDDVIQDLAGLGFALESMENQADPTTRSLAHRGAAILQRDIALLRELVSSLYPPDLDSHNLADAIGDLCGPLRRSGTTIVAAVQDPLSLDPIAAALLYRVARESLMNVQKHARATHVTVTLAATEGEAMLAITDNGVGFDQAKPTSSGHHGLQLLRDTAMEAGGVFTVTSGAEGTSVKLRLRLD